MAALALSASEPHVVAYTQQRPGPPDGWGGTFSQAMARTEPSSRARTEKWECLTIIFRYCTQGCHLNHGDCWLIPVSAASHPPSPVRLGPRRHLMAVAIVTLCVFLMPAVCVEHRSGEMRKKRKTLFLQACCNCQRNTRRDPARPRMLTVAVWWRKKTCVCQQLAHMFTHKCENKERIREEDMILLLAMAYADQWDNNNNNNNNNTL
ncbi:uncharacterized protein LOC143502769 [Brachyhypopomus gauderio]|uniref:uncharacterized protein LOC143502769 n=1 Tax=Brachyhypopomus gauderio TaxID=698409 RepID=UPI0040415BAA